MWACSISVEDLWKSLNLIVNRQGCGLFFMCSSKQLRLKLGMEMSFFCFFLAKHFLFNQVDFYAFGIDFYQIWSLFNLFSPVWGPFFMVSRHLHVFHIWTRNGFSIDFQVLVFTRVTLFCRHSWILLLKGASTPGQQTLFREARWRIGWCGWWWMVCCLKIW